MQLSLQSLWAGSEKDYGLRSTDWKNGVTKTDYVLAATTLVLVTMILVTEVPATAALVTVIMVPTLNVHVVDVMKALVVFLLLSRVGRIVGCGGA